MIVHDLYEEGIEYGKVQIGEVFKLYDDYYIKTEIFEEDCDDLYAVNLLTGGKYPIGKKVLVRVLNAEMKVY